MATGYCDPNGDSTPLQWTGNFPAPPVTHFTAIDDGTRQPTTPNTSDYIGCIPPNAAGLQDTSHMTSLTVGSVSSIVIWAHGVAGASGRDATANIYVAGAWQTAVALGFTTSQSWKSVTFSGTWTQGDLDALEVRFTLTGASGSTLVVHAMYAAVTYTAAGGGGNPYDGRIDGAIGGAIGGRISEP